MSTLTDVLIDLGNDSDDDRDGEFCNCCRFSNFNFCVLFEEPVIADFDKSGLLRTRRCD